MNDNNLNQDLMNVRRVVNDSPKFKNFLLNGDLFIIASSLIKLGCYYQDDVVISTTLKFIASDISDEAFILWIGIHVINCLSDDETKYFIDYMVKNELGGLFLILKDRYWSKEDTQTE